MNTLLTITQTLVALGILNVWIIRYNKPTRYRGGGAKNIREEFAAYGLPFWFMVLVVSVKVLLAIGLIVGVWIPVLTKPASVILALLMLGAMAMHIKIKDPIIRALPATLLFLLSTFIALYI